LSGGAPQRSATHSRLTSERSQAEGKVDPKSREIGLEFQNRTRRIQTFSPKLFKGRVHDIVAAFYDAGVAYTFDLDMSETNNFDPQIDLLNPFRRGKFTMGIKGNFDRKRQNERLFTVSDSFSGLIHLPDDYCVDPIANRNCVVESENYIYPITGRIGVKRMMQDFIELTLFGSLGGPANNTKGPPTPSIAIFHERRSIVRCEPLAAYPGTQAILTREDGRW
jgi:hypothetical protein